MCTSHSAARRRPCRRPGLCNVMGMDANAKIGHRDRLRRGRRASSPALAESRQADMALIVRRTEVRNPTRSPRSVTAILRRSGRRAAPCRTWPQYAGDNSQRADCEMRAAARFPASEALTGRRLSAFALQPAREFPADRQDDRLRASRIQFVFVRQSGVVPRAIAAVRHATVTAMLFNQKDVTQRVGST